MRKIWISVLIVMLIAFPLAFSQQLFIGDQHILTWDLEPEPANGTLTYEVCVVDQDGGGTPVIVDEVTIPPVTIDISTYDFEVTFGVRTVLTLSVDAIIEDVQYQAGDRVLSEWNYSDINGEATPNPFVAWRDVHAPGGFEHVQ